MTRSKASLYFCIALLISGIVTSYAKKETEFCHEARKDCEMKCEGMKMVGAQCPIMKISIMPGRLETRFLQATPQPGLFVLLTI